MKTLFNPFERFRENQLLVFGGLITIVGSLLGYFFMARFDGVLDLHFGSAVTIYNPFIDNCVNIFCLSLFLYLAGLLINKKTRLIDVLVVAIIARIPLYFLTLFNAGGRMSLLGEKIMENVKTDPFKSISGYDVGLIAVSGILTILVMIWYIALLFNGFKTAANAKGIKSILLFIICVILSELVSKLIISLIP
jgi:hypothetical protein